MQGAVDWFHLSEELPTRDWAKAYTVNQRVMARVLYVDPALKRVALTLKPCLVAGAAMPPSLPVGTVVPEAVIYRIDPGLGMLLQTPMKKGPKKAAYVHVSCPPPAPLSLRWAW